MTEPEVTIDGRTLQINDSTVKTEFPIKKTLIYEGLVITLLKLESDIDDNIIAYNRDGEKIWQIEPITTEETRGSKTWVDIKEIDGKLVAINWDETSWEVDPETGEIDFQWGRWSGYASKSEE